MKTVDNRLFDKIPDHWIMDSLEHHLRNCSTFWKSLSICQSQFIEETLSYALEKIIISFGYLNYTEKKNFLAQEIFFSIYGID